ncbi:MAG: hypothetical protein EOO92_06935 [Pedobacter sp.]|nr:MAG: hypothetical protein EOO92_06935 [Pedobacter sp.]
MKNAFKFGFLALAISLTVAACGGSESTSESADTTIVDTTLSTTDTTIVDTTLADTAAVDSAM